MRHHLRSRLLCGLATTLLALTFAATASAADRPATHGAPLPGNPAFAQPAQLPAAATQPTIQAMVARVCAVNGTIYSFDGAPVAGAEVYAGYVQDGAWYYSPKASTDPTGAYSIGGLPATATGFVETWYQQGTDWRGIWLSPLAFADGSTSTVDVRPGRVGWQANRSADADWNQWSSPEVWIENADDSGAQTDSQVDTYGAASGSAEAAPGTVDWASMNFWWNEADEWQPSVPVAVTSGVDAGQQMTFNESEALRSSLTSPYWLSCRPGTVVKLKLQNWPVGYAAAFSGSGDTPSGPTSSFGGKTWVSPSTDPPAVSLRIPSTAKPGYGYIVSARRTDNPAGSIQLRDYLQLCSFKSTKSVVTRGTMIRLSGVVPTQGHWGSTAGQRKIVAIWIAKPGKALPTRWDPRGHGWYLLGTVRTNGYGAFHTPLVKVMGSATLVAQYGGDNWYWGAYTSKISIRVR